MNLQLEQFKEKVISYFKKRNREISISKSFETKLGKLIENDLSLNDDIILCLHISENNKESKTYEIPITRRGFWERPYYFNISKKKLINFIK